jgi:hypothetical protein
MGGFVLIRALLSLCLGVAVASGSAVASAAEPGIESTYADHTRGVELARAGRYDEGLAVLVPLVQRFPNDYPLVRDVVLINTWKGDCVTALRYFDRIRSRPTLDDYLLQPVADCAVKRARVGDYQVGINTLTTLLPRVKDDYSLRRDLAVITHWKGDCAGALRWFETIRNDPRNPPYLIAPMADCLRRYDRPIEADAFVEAALARYPSDRLLLHERDKSQVALRLDDGFYDDRPAYEISVLSANSDRDLRETTLRAEASASLATPLRVYARYAYSRADQSAFAAGELNRIGIGLRWRVSPRLLIDEGISSDIHQANREGVHSRLVYQPYDPWKFSLGHDTYAEDISVRARAAGIEARRSYVDAEYRDLRDVWYGYGIASRYDFTDTNRRDVLFATLGYGYSLLPEREQRIFVEWYRSRNTLNNAVYFNPEHDQSVSLIHATAFIYDTRFKRHVDTLSFSVGTYAQAGFGSHGTYGVSYEQDYDFDDDRNLIVGVGIDRNYFDGEREDDWRVSLQYRRRF